MSTEPSPTRSGQTPESDEQPVRARGRQLSAVVVAAAVLLAGGGGAYWASNAGSDSAPAGGTSDPPKLALDGLAAQHSGEDGGDGKPGVAPGEPHNSQTYKANKKLPEGPEAASVHRTPTSVTRGAVARLAETLGVPGSPEKKDGRWVVGEEGASDARPQLTVNDGRTAGNWTFQRGDLSAMACSKPLPTVPGGDAPAQSGPPEKAPDSCPGMPGSGKGDPVSEEEAKSAVESALKTLDLRGAELDAGTTTGSMRMVSATPEVDGMPARDWNSTFTVDKDGKVVRGHGSLGKLRKGDSYPVMTAGQTLKHLNKQGAAGTSGGSGTVREPAPGKGAQEPSGESGAVAPSEPLKVTDAEFGLVTRYTLGKPLLVPSWIYEVELQGGENTASVAHPAIQPEFLKPAGPAGTGADPGKGQDGSEPGSGSGPDPGQAQKPGSPAPIQAVTSYKADGRTVELTFWGGVCGGYRASAEESGKTVEVTVRPEKSDSKKVCVKMAEQQTVEVELEKALGDREVVDGRDGEGVPRGG